MSQPTPGQHGFESAGCGENQVNRFTTEAEIWHVHVAGQVIRTTEEHPFWVVDKGWVPTVKLLPGDILLGRDGKQVPVEEVLATGVLETVHNFRVAEYHTYFVGGGEWQFDVWAHNRCLNAVEQLSQGDDEARRSLRRSMMVVGHSGIGAQAHHIIPWELRKMAILERAAAGGFAINRSNNGLFLGPNIHFGSHPNYTAQVVRRLNQIDYASMTDKEVAEAVQKVADKLRTNLRRRTTLLE